MEHDGRTDTFVFVHGRAWLGARLIDWIVRRPHADLRFVRSVFLTVGNSDHRSVRAVYDYQPACQ
jgi:hypothetical protein